MNYPNGSIMRQGDLVWWNEGESVGHVEKMIELEEEYKEWGSNEPVVFLSNYHPYTGDRSWIVGTAYGLGDLEEEGIEKLSKEEELEICRIVNIANETSDFDLEKAHFSIRTNVEDGIIKNWNIQVWENREVVGEIKVQACDGNK